MVYDVWLVQLNIETDQRYSRKRGQSGDVMSDKNGLIKLTIANQRQVRLTDYSLYSDWMIGVVNDGYIRVFILVIALLIYTTRSYISAFRSNKYNV